MPLRRAKLGNMADSQKLANDLNRQFPKMLRCNINTLPVLRALAALKEGDLGRRKSEQELKSAERYESRRKRTERKW